jgi:oligosaccharide repeat unit polymerase
MLLIALLILYGGGHFYYYSIAGIDDRTSARVTDCLVLMWMGLLLGIEAVRLVWQPASSARHSVLKSWAELPIRLREGDEAIWKLLAIGLVVYLGLMFFLLGKPSQIASFLAVDSELAKRELRQFAGSQGGYFFTLTVASVAPFVAILATVRAATTRSIDDLAIAVALTMFVLLFKFASFHKSQWVWFVMQLLLAFRLLRSPRANLALVLAGAVALVAALLVGAQLAYPDLDVVELWGYLLYRILEITNQGLYQFVYLYPEYIPHAHGMNVGMLHTLFGDGELLAAHTRVADFFGSFGATFNAMFIGDAWVDFAYVGVFVASCIVGSAVKGLDLYAGTLGRTPVAIALVASAFSGVITLLSTSAFTALLTGGLLLLPALVFCVRLIVPVLRRIAFNEKIRRGAPLAVSDFGPQ